MDAVKVEHDVDRCKSYSTPARQVTLSNSPKLLLACMVFALVIASLRHNCSERDRSRCQASTSGEASVEYRGNTFTTRSTSTVAILVTGEVRTTAGRRFLLVVIPQAADQAKSVAQCEFSLCENSKILGVDHDGIGKKSVERCGIRHDIRTLKHRESSRRRRSQLGRGESSRTVC